MRESCSLVKGWSDEDKTKDDDRHKRFAKIIRFDGFGWKALEVPEDEKEHEKTGGDDAAVGDAEVKR